MSVPAVSAPALRLPSIVVRPASPHDFTAIQAIYAHHVVTGLGSFEEEPPTVEELRRRHSDWTARGLPYLAADIGGRVCGFAYAAPFRPRSAYRNTVEDSIYVDPAFQRQGIGATLLSDLIERCTALGYRQMVAVIGDSANRGSIAVHRRAGFREVGTLHAVGRKFGRWVDSVIMQRSLGEGDQADPAR